MALNFAVSVFGDYAVVGIGVPGEGVVGVVGVCA